MVCRILVADDSSTIQKVIRIGLAGIPTDIKSAGSLVEAAKTADQRQLDLIIADAGLPGVSTASDFIKLAERAGGVPLIILMGSYEAVRETDLRAVGIKNIIKKPFPPGELPQLVQELTRSTEIPLFDLNLPPGPKAVAPRPQVPPFPSASASPSSASTASTASPPVSPPAVPFFDIEPAQRGLPAFNAIDFGHRENNQVAKIPVPDFPTSSFSAVPPPTTKESLADEILRKELKGWVETTVTQFCQQNFKSIARDVLTTELRRLAEEKARYLVDQP